MEPTTRPSASNPIQPHAPASNKDKLREQAETIRDDVRELGGIARDAAKEKLDSARRATSEFYEDKKEKVSEYEDQLISYVREKPIKSVLIAAGVGAFLGLVVLRR
jgi:ElaB/YqjD/DUF883 family membrane-anchored ribosome-binding protein